MNIRTVSMVFPGGLSSHSMAAMLLALKGSDKVISVGWRWCGTKRNGVMVASPFAYCVSIDATVDKLAHDLMAGSWDHSLDECHGTSNLYVAVSYDI